MSAKLRTSVIFAVCVLSLGTVLAYVAIAQTVQEEKKVIAQTAVQSQFSYMKMVQSEVCTRQMAQNRYTYEKKVQRETASNKMTQTSKSVSAGSQEQQGGQEDQGNQGQAEGQGNQGASDSHANQGGSANGAGKK